MVNARLSATLEPTEDVPPGYKQTEVGVIPEEWEVASLVAIANIATGNTPPTSNPKNYGDEYPFVSPSDISEAKYISKTERGLSKKGFAISRSFPKDSILFVSIGSTIGKCGIALEELTSNQQINAIFPSPNFSVDYLYYTICSAAPRIKTLAGAQAVPIVNKTEFSETSISLAPLPEQRAIAEALSDVDGLLGALEALIAKKRAIKQAAMQQLFTGKTRLPGFGKDKKYKKTEVGVFPQEWRIIKLEECLLRPPDYGINAPAVTFSDNLPTYLRITDISEHGRFLTENRVSVDKENSSHYCLTQGDLVFARTGASVGKSYLYNRSDGFLVFAGFLIRVKPDPNKLVTAYLANYVKTPAYWKWVGVMSMRSGQPGINGKEYGQLPVALPSPEEQTAIAAVLSDMDAGISALERRRDKTRAIKQGMMQQLLTGRIRLV